MPTQISVDRFYSAEDRLVEGWATVEVVDKQNDILPIEEFEKAMFQVMKRGGIIMDSHSNKPIGRILKWEKKTHADSGKVGIYTTYIINKDGELEDHVWKEILDGKRKGLSFGGLAKQREIITRDGGANEINILHGLDGYEISSVTEPANPLALNESVNYLTKADNSTIFVMKSWNPKNNAHGGSLPPKEEATKKEDGKMAEEVKKSEAPSIESRLEALEGNVNKILAMFEAAKTQEGKPAEEKPEAEVEAQKKQADALATTIAEAFKKQEESITKKFEELKKSAGVTVVDGGRPPVNAEPRKASKVDEILKKLDGPKAPTMGEAQRIYDEALKAIREGN